MKPIEYVLVGGKTALFQLKDIYPECFFNIKDKPGLIPMQCFIEGQCPLTSNCGEVLARRLHYIFDQVVPTAEMVICYFTYHDSSSLRGAVFTNEFSLPKLITVNPYAFKKLMKDGIHHFWTPPSEFLL